MPGYERNAHAAATLLGLLEAHVELDPTIVAAVRDLVARANAAGSGAVELQLVDEQRRSRTGDQSRSGARVKPKRS